MLKRYKVTITSNASGTITFKIDPTKSLELLVCSVTLPAQLSNVERNVSIERTEGTILAEQKNQYLTSQASCITFPNKIIVPYFDPSLVIDTRTVAVSDDITFDCIYREVDLLG